MRDVIVDVREPEEYSSGHVKGAINLPLSKINKEMVEANNIAGNDRIIVYCRSGNRSGLVLNKLNSWGYKNVINGINQSKVEAGLN